MCGAESWDSIELFGKSKKEFLMKILKLPNGIPSHDTINRVFSLINAGKFGELFIEWVNSIKDDKIKHEVISIDGKTVKEDKRQLTPKIAYTYCKCMDKHEPTCFGANEGK